MSRVVVASLEELLAEARARGIRGAALQVVDEVRPRLREGAAVEVARQRWVDVVAYAGGVVITARLEGADPAAVEAALKGAGLAVRRRSANLG